MKTLERIDVHKILAGELEENAYQLKTCINGNDFYKTYCIYNDDKIECTVFKNHKRIIEVDIVLDMLETNYIKVETKSLKIRNKNEVQYVIRNMIKPLVQKLVA